MDVIKFANGAVYDCPHLATLPKVDDGIAYVGISGVDYATAARIFSDESMTREMEWGNYRLVGYTRLRYVMVEPYGFKACLEGGHDELIE